MANGRVITGYSKPYVAVYNSATTPTYTNGMILARGVSVNVTPEFASDNVYYADNVSAETEAGTFTSGSFTLTVDGLKWEAKTLIMGLPNPESFSYGESQTVEYIPYGDNISFPYMGVGFIVRYMSGGVTTYVPIVLTKARFNTEVLDAATQEDSITWQSQELTGSLSRDDSAAHNWKIEFAEQNSEAEAEAILKAYFNVSAE